MISISSCASFLPFSCLRISPLILIAIWSSVERCISETRGQSCSSCVILRSIVSIFVDTENGCELFMNGYLYKQNKVHWSHSSILDAASCVKFSALFFFCTFDCFFLGIVYSLLILISSRLRIDMLAKQYRLTTKDIRYIIRQRSILRWTYFYVTYCPQYQNNAFNQFSISIPKRLSKHAVVRNRCNRIFFDSIEKHWLITMKHKWRFGKFFFCLHKHLIAECAKKQMLSTDIISAFDMYCEKDLPFLLSS